MRPDTTSAIHAHLIATMATRAASLGGEARRALETRLAELRALDGDSRETAPDADTTPPNHASLRALLDQFAGEGSPEHPAYPELPALTEFRQLWATLRADSQLQQSITPVPADAGPLNSTALASRAITLMRELSPGYLRSFVAYVDDLAWLEQWGAGGAVATSSAVAAKKRARRKPPA